MQVLAVETDAQKQAMRSPSSDQGEVAEERGIKDGA